MEIKNKFYDDMVCLVGVLEELLIVIKFELVGWFIKCLEKFSEI